VASCDIPPAQQTHRVVTSLVAHAVGMAAQPAPEQRSEHLLDG
jgi:hypothetical protein